MSMPTSHASATNPQLPSYDLASAQTVHSRALAGIAGGIGSAALQWVLQLLVPFLLNIAHLDPTLLPQYQQWDAGQGDPTFNIGEIAHGFRVNHIHNVGIAISLVRHDTPRPGPVPPQPGPQPGTAPSNPPTQATPPSPHATP